MGRRGGEQTGLSREEIWEQFDRTEGYLKGCMKASAVETS